MTQDIKFGYHRFRLVAKNKLVLIRAPAQLATNRQEDCITFTATLQILPTLARVKSFQRSVGRVFLGLLDIEYVATLRHR